MICLICKENHLFYTKHLIEKHKLSVKEYYDLYVKKENEGYCLWCKKPTIFRDIRRGYKIFCNSSCCANCEWKNASKEWKEQRNKKVGSNISKEGRQRISFAARKQWKERTLEENKDVIEKGKKTKLQKYGNLNNFEKYKQTCLTLYGVDNIRKSKQYTDYISANKKAIHEKRQQTLFNHYGTKNIHSLQWFKDKIRLKLRSGTFDIFCAQLFLKQIIPLFDKEYYVKSKKDFKYRCLRCNKEFVIADASGIQKVVCPNKIHRFKSKLEYEIKEALEKECNIINIENNKRWYKDKKNHHQEIDLFIKDKNIGVDYHGLYYHCDLFKEQKYHFEKYLFFKNKGIKLIQIFENEWRFKRKIVISILKTNFGLSKKIYGRKCVLKEITNKEYQLFLEQNHLDGYVPAMYKYGLFYENELVSVIGFRKSRFKNNENELVRFSNKIDTIVIGALSKFIKRYCTEQNVEEIVSYCNLRYFSGNGYVAAGFQIDKITQPNYFYFKPEIGILHNRIEFQKHKLKNSLQKYDDNLSEYENMMNNKFLRIFDAGNLRLVYHNKKDLITATV